MHTLPASVHYPFLSGRVLVDELCNFIVNGESVAELLFFFVLPLSMLYFFNFFLFLVARDPTLDSRTASALTSCFFSFSL